MNLNDRVTELEKQIKVIKYIATYIAGMISVRAGYDLLPMVSAMMG